MAKTYKGIGYLTGRRLSLNSGGAEVVVDDDTKSITERRDGKIL